MTDLFDYPYHPGHVRGSDTSESAARSMLKPSAVIRDRVLRHIMLCPSGATCDEVEQHLALSHQTASARIRELAMMELIADTGQRRTTRSGRSARVYAVANG